MSIDSPRGHNVVLGSVLAEWSPLKFVNTKSDMDEKRPNRCHKRPFVTSIGTFLGYSSHFGGLLLWVVVR